MKENEKPRQRGPYFGLPIRGHDISLICVTRKEKSLKNCMIGYYAKVMLTLV